MERPRFRGVTNVTSTTRSGLVNLAFQAIGTNAGAGWHVQGDWVHSVTLAEQYEAAYLEVYYADFMPLDEEHRIVAAFTHDGSEGWCRAGIPWFSTVAQVA